IQAIMHRLEDYIAVIQKEVSERVLDDIQRYCEIARDMLEQDAASVDIAELVRKLPSKRHDFNAEDVAIPNPVEVLLVMREKAGTLMFGRELESCGMRVSTAQRSFEALEIAVMTKPDYVIISGVLDELSGIDIAMALNAM